MSKRAAAYIVCECKNDMELLKRATEDAFSAPESAKKAKLRDRLAMEIQLRAELRGDRLDLATGRDVCGQCGCLL